MNEINPETFESALHDWARTRNVTVTDAVKGIFLGGYLKGLEAAEKVAIAKINEKENHE